MGRIEFISNCSIDVLWLGPSLCFPLRFITYSFLWSVCWFVIHRTRTVGICIFGCVSFSLSLSQDSHIIQTLSVCLGHGLDSLSFSHSLTLSLTLLLFSLSLSLSLIAVAAHICIYTCFNRDRTAQFPLPLPPSRSGFSERLMTNRLFRLLI